MNSRRFFNASAWGYDWMTAQSLWREQIARTLEHAPQRSRIRRVLDLGCGPGVSSFVLAECLPEAQIVGIDLAEQMIERARRHHRRSFAHLPNVSFEVADASELPFEEGSFDLAVGHSFLYLVPDRRAVLAGVRRVIAPGGALVLMEPHRGGGLRRATGRAITTYPQWRGGRRGELGRFGLSMVLWRLVSAKMGRMKPDEVEELFRSAGFGRVYTEPTLGGLGIHCVGHVEEESR